MVTCRLLLLTQVSNTGNGSKAGHAPPQADGSRAFPPGDKGAVGGPNTASGVWHQSGRHVTMPPAVFGPPKSLLRHPAHAPFKPARQTRTKGGQQQIQPSNGEPYLEGKKGGGHKLHTPERQFLYGDDRNDGGVLDG